jgi:hypothetical protein
MTNVFISGALSAGLWKKVVSICKGWLLAVGCYYAKKRTDMAVNLDTLGVKAASEASCFILHFELEAHQLPF